MAHSSARQTGFTLIELMIVVAIVAILAAIAIPTYNDQIRKTRRATAKGELMSVVQAKERFHSLNGTYVGSACGTALDFYTITCSGLTATAFLVTATPTGDQLNDARCLVLSINQRDVRTVSGTGTVADCW